MTLLNISVRDGLAQSGARVKDIMAGPGAHPIHQDHAPRQRDMRLDFFRGLGMFIILIAHIPWNSWTDWIPARFGFSDAADMFVFCSGMASSLAFARVFVKAGWWLGTARIAHRVWQVYWAHIGGFLVVLSVMILADATLGLDHYVREELNLASFFDDTKMHLVGLLTLSYVPNYFDILPMYLAILAMIPIVMGLASLHRGLAPAFVLGMWLLANTSMLDLVADRTTGRLWFFNPFGWQIVFFTGFAFVRGWLPVPPRSLKLAIAALVFVLAAAPFSCQAGFSCFAGYGTFPWLGEVHLALQPWIDKMNMGPLRYFHFLATAYLAWLAVGVKGSHLHGLLVAVTCRVGQQTLAVFLSGLVVAQLMGIFLDVVGRSFLLTAFANLLGCSLLVLTAFVVAWFKSMPWKDGSTKKSSGQA